MVKKYFISYYIKKTKSFGWSIIDFNKKINSDTFGEFEEILQNGKYEDGLYPVIIINWKEFEK